MILGLAGGLGLSQAMELTLSHIPKITPNNPGPLGEETEILFQSFQAEHFRPKSFFLCAFDLLTLP